MMLRNCPNAFGNVLSHLCFPWSASHLLFYFPVALSFVPLFVHVPGDEVLGMRSFIQHHKPLEQARSSRVRLILRSAPLIWGLAQGPWGLRCFPCLERLSRLGTIIVVLCPHPTFICWNPNPSTYHVTVFGDRISKEVIKFKWGY